MVGKKQRRGNSVACLQRNSKASLTQHKGNCLPATSFRVQGCCFSGCTPNRRGAMVVTYKIRQGERTGKLRRHTLQNAPAPKGTRVSECGQDQSGKMSSPSKSVTIKSSFFFFFVSLQTSGVAHPFFFLPTSSASLAIGQAEYIKKVWSLQYFQTLPESFLAWSPCFKQWSHQLSLRVNLPQVQTATGKSLSTRNCVP